MLISVSLAELDSFSSSKSMVIESDLYRTLHLEFTREGRVTLSGRYKLLPLENLKFQIYNSSILVSKSRLSIMGFHEHGGY